MVLRNDDSQEERARYNASLFMADLINEPFFLNPHTGQRVADPEEAMAYLLNGVANRDPIRLHTICRAAWGIYTANPGVTRWQSVKLATEQIDSLPDE